MDWRIKNFESEARAAFAFLLDQGFAASTEAPTDTARRPTTVVVKFLSEGATVATALSLGFAGEDSIHTTLLTVDGFSEFGPSVAH